MLRRDPRLSWNTISSLYANGQVKCRIGNPRPDLAEGTVAADASMPTKECVIVGLCYKFSRKQDYVQDGATYRIPLSSSQQDRRSNTA